MEGLLRKAAVAVAVSMVFILVFMAVFGVRVEDVLSVGLIPLAISASLSMMALAARGLRFLILVNRFGRGIGVLRALKVRLASEFLALISFSAVGDEAFRMGWLIKEGTSSGRAAWVAYFEIFCDVLVGTALSLLSAVILLSRGAFFIGAAVAAVGGSVLAGHVLFFAYSVKSSLEVPDRITRIAVRVLGEKGRRLVERVEEMLRGFSETARLVVRKGERKIMAINLALTIAAAFLLAGSLQILLSASGIKINLLESLMAVYASIALATIPITIGGSGLSEVGAAFSTLVFSSKNPWTAVIAWRITTYHIPLLICGLLLVLVLLEMGSSHRASAQGREAS